MSDVFSMWRASWAVAAAVSEVLSKVGGDECSTDRVSDSGGSAGDVGVICNSPRGASEALTQKRTPSGTTYVTGRENVVACDFEHHRHVRDVRRWVDSAWRGDLAGSEVKP